MNRRGRRVSQPHFALDRLTPGTRCYVEHEGYGTVVDVEPATNSVGVKVDRDGVVVQASLAQITSIIIDVNNIIYQEA
jgi:hypothetical protein